MRDQLARLRVVGYVRISNDKQERKSDNQESEIQAYADNHGITIQHLYKDNEGRNPRDDGRDRPQFQAMYNDAKAKKFDAVLCAYQERLGLHGFAFAHWVFEFAGEGVSLWETADGGRNLSSADPMTIERTARETANSMGWCDKHGRKTLRERIVAGERGYYQGGLPPYYCDVLCYDPTLTRVKYRLVYHNRYDKTQILYDERGGERYRQQYSNNCPHKDRGDILRLAPTMQTERLETARRIFHWFNDECISYSQIASRLNQENIPAYYGGYWTLHSVKAMMLNPAVIGQPAQCKGAMAKYAERRNGDIVNKPPSVLTCKPRYKRNDTSEWVFPNERVFDPIVSDELYQAVLEKITNRRRGGMKPSHNSVAWLGGFLYCARCGRRMGFNTRKHKTTNGGYNTIPYYRCSGYQHYGQKGNPFGCKAYLIKASVFEELIEQYLITTQQKADFDRRVEVGKPIIESKPISFDAPDPTHKQGIVAEKKRLERERDTILERAFQLESDYAMEKAKEKVKASDARIAELEDELRRIENRLTKEEYEKRAKCALTTIREGTDRAKKEALSKVIERIDCYFEDTPGKIRNYRLARVVFSPVALCGSWANTEEECARNRAMQKRILATAGKRDGVEVVTKMNWNYEGFIGKENPHGVLTTEGAGEFAELRRQVG